MTVQELSQRAQLRLDGEAIDIESAEEKNSIDQLLAAVTQYRDTLEVPGSEVDRNIMDVVAPARHSIDHRNRTWRWFLQPQSVRIRPALAVAALLCLVVAAGLLRTESAEQITVAGNQLPIPTNVGTVLVRFELTAPDAGTVRLAGSFNEWDASSVELRPSGKDGVWTATVLLKPGQHEYLFVVDNESWIQDPNAHAQVDDGFGQKNSVIVVGARGVIRS